MLSDDLRKFFFNKNIIINNDYESCEHSSLVLLAFAKYLGIEITEGSEYASLRTLMETAEMIGTDVPEPFYKGFPESVAELNTGELLLDQLLHYYLAANGETEMNHSLFERYVEHLKFQEKVTLKKYKIISDDDLYEDMSLYLDPVLSSSRPLSDHLFTVITDAIMEYGYELPACASKDTMLRLYLEFGGHSDYTIGLMMSDVIKLVEIINRTNNERHPYITYRGKSEDSLTNLHLTNRQRKLVTKLMDYLFTHGHVNLRECAERRAAWVGLLHHIHYKPVNQAAEDFVKALRNHDVRSVYSDYENALAVNDVAGAIALLKKEKGDAAILRHLDQLLSYCKSDEQISYVLDCISTRNTLVLLQLYHSYYARLAEKWLLSGKRHVVSQRTFRFVKDNMLHIAVENMISASRRRTDLSGELILRILIHIEDNLKSNLKGRLGKVYLEEGLDKLCLPLQESTSQGGFGLLPRGSRLSIPEGKKIRAFTYWEKVNDIDLSCFGLSEDGTQFEFSWRTMGARYTQMNCDVKQAIVFSGDQTMGYDGGSEYFDIDPAKFKELYPKCRYLVFCDNVFSASTFKNCICTAGYMLRDLESSGEVFEPKTVKSSFLIDCDSTFAYLYAIDLERHEFIWLNLVRSGRTHVAGTTTLDFLKPYFQISDHMNWDKFLRMAATEIVTDPKEADVYVGDHADKLTFEGRKPDIIRTTDMERLFVLMH